MVVQHNLTAMNSNRMLGITTKSQAKSTEKLSSGYKINRAADDAAGLSISEKMRKQIRGLTQASANAEDGISAVQTAEGALTEVHDMLQRLNELAVKAANGTNSETDRSYIQSEVDQLVTEIDRVATTTKFNETYLLKGTSKNDKVAELTYGTAAASITEAGIDAATGKGELSITRGATTTVTATSGTSNDAGSYKLDTVVVGGKTYGYIHDITKAADTDVNFTDDYAITKAEATATAGVFKSQEEMLTAIKLENDNIKDMSVDGDKISIETFSDTNKTLDLDLHVGADSTEDNKINLSIEMMSARGLGINGLVVTDDSGDKATAAIDVIADAIQKVSTQRSNLGAVQNRLEHTINNLDNVVENTTAAESQIRDTDMATEMVRYSNNNILAQAGQAMLAQANQSNSGVMSLLQ